MARTEKEDRAIVDQQIRGCRRYVIDQLHGGRRQAGNRPHATLQRGREGVGDENVPPAYPVAPASQSDGRKQGKCQWAPNIAHREMSTDTQRDVTKSRKTFVGTLGVDTLFKNIGRAVK